MFGRFDGETENPELIWGAPERAELRAVLAEQRAAVGRGESGGDPRRWWAWAPPHAAWRVRFARPEAELAVGGLYIRRI